MFTKNFPQLFSTAVCELQMFIRSLPELFAKNGEHLQCFGEQLW
jgi:hypothetical protein